jgi:hypothetical protein
MDLKFTYADNSVRVIRPTEDFFCEDQVIMLDKLKKMGQDTGILYKAEILDGSKQILSVEYERFKPTEKEKVDPKVCAKGRMKRKKMRRGHLQHLENGSFTMKSVGGFMISLAKVKALRKERRKNFKTAA